NGVSGGNTVSDAQGWAIEDRIVHGVDTPGVGLVRVRNGQVYLTTNSFAAPATAASVQRAVTVAAGGDRIAIQSGTYADNTSIDKDITLDGEGSGPSALVTFVPATSSPVIRITST